MFGLYCRRMVLFVVNCFFFLRLSMVGFIMDCFFLLCRLVRCFMMRFGVNCLFLWLFGHRMDFFLWCLVVGLLAIDGLLMRLFFLDFVMGLRFLFCLRFVMGFLCLFLRLLFSWFFMLFFGLFLSWLMFFLRLRLFDVFCLLNFFNLHLLRFFLRLLRLRLTRLLNRLFLFLLRRLFHFGWLVHCLNSRLSMCFMFVPFLLILMVEVGFDHRRLLLW